MHVYGNSKEFYAFNMTWKLLCLQNLPFLFIYFVWACLLLDNKQEGERIWMSFGMVSTKIFKRKSFFFIEVTKECWFTFDSNVITTHNIAIVMYGIQFFKLIFLPK